MAKIITFSGRAKCGKNLCATLIKKELQSKGIRCFELAFADWLKCISVKNFGYDESKKAEFREHLQRWGTDVIREIDPDFWVKIIAMTINLLKDEFDVFLLTDARFENELSPVWLGDYPIYNVLVRRDNLSDLTVEELHHSSEQMADGNADLFDLILRNSGDIMDLEDLCSNYADYFAAWIRGEKLD